MKKIFLKICILLTLLFSYHFTGAGGAINFNGAQEATGKIQSVSIDKKSGNIESQISSTTNNLLQTFKVIIGGLLVLYIIYAGVMMIISMGDDEKQLSDAKRSMWYAVVALLFVNIPTTLYNAFSSKNTSDDVTGNVGSTQVIHERNIFMNSQQFGSTLGGMITFLEITIVVLAIFVFVYNGIKIMLSAGEDKDVSEAKNKILRSLAGLILVGIAEVWRNLIFIGDFKGAGNDLFSKLANLALFFAGPIAIFFLSLAGYYYITAGGDDEKIKKAKNIVFNTVIATLILLGMYTFLLDLKTLTF